MVGLFGILCWGIWALLSLAYLVFGVYMLVDCIQNEPGEGNEKLIWVLVIIFAFGIGPLIYFFARRPKRIELFGR